MTDNQHIMEKVVALAKRRGFIFPGSEIYGGLSGTWDYGPLGTLMKQHLKQEFWKAHTHERDDIVGLDAAIFMHPKVWEASGHTEAFSDPLVECKICHQRFRADHLEELKAHEDMHAGKKEKTEWTDPKTFNLLVAAELGSVEGEKMKVYLRGEITQGVHVNCKNVLDSTRVKIPFGVVQIGKAFRNEITPGNFLFRMREFEQMELQYFVPPDQAESMQWFEYWKNERMQWYMSLGMRPEKLRFREHEPDERAHYARAAWDIEYDTPFGGWKEMLGIHHRGDWDLKRHSQFSGADLSYFDEASKTRYTPWVIETSGGVDRALLFFLLDAYREEGERVILKLHPKLAPYKAAVFPLLANKPHLVEKARQIFKDLKSKDMNIAWDDRGNIGKRYYSQDEIGTPWCITIDFQTLEDDTVTVRDRDTAKQERIVVLDLSQFLEEKMR